MTTDADYARRSAAQFDVATHVPAVAYLVSISAQPRQSDIRRLMVLQRALADLVEQLAVGQDFDREIATVGACAQEWMEDRAVELSRCCCPMVAGAGSEDIIAVPECPAHGDGSP